MKNSKGQRPVENLVSAPVGRRYGGVQPANTARAEMFGLDAPIWRFLSQFGGAADPHGPVTDMRVFETYPVLTMIALGWNLPDSVRPTGRLPKYNPQRSKTFSISDWEHVCQQTLHAFEAYKLQGLSQWLRSLADNRSPRKADQDRLDACICLLVALYIVELKECLTIEDTDTGYIIVPYGNILREELHFRCNSTNRDHNKWVRSFVLKK